MPTPPAAPPHLSGPPTVFYKPAPVPNRPGMLMLKDGSIIAPPPDLPGPASSSSSCPNPKQWSGNTPPSCDNNGAFRRVFSNAGLFYMSGEIILPSSNPKMPVGGGPNRDTGYIYMEGWPGAGSSNSEVGLIYAAKSNTYTFYYSTPATGMKVSNVHFQAGVTVVAYLNGMSNNVGGCSKLKPPCLDGGVAQVGTNEPAGYVVISNPGWTYGCCIFARMTTIAQKPKDVFNDGSEFGPVQWSRWQLGRCTEGGSACGPTYYPWSGGGVQSWPNNNTKIIVTGRQGEMAETDTIDLHK